jgi:hypothetical protein
MHAHSFNAAALVFLVASTVFARPSDADRAAARSLAQEGQQALDSKDYAVAAERFARADSLVHAPTLLLALARAQIGLGLLVEAHENCARIQREGVAPGSPKPWARAYEDAAKEIDAVSARLPWVVVRITGASNPDVTLDGSPVLPAALGIKRPVNPGRHELRATAAGARPVKRTFSVVDGQIATVEIDLDTEAPPPIPAPAVPAVSAPLAASGTAWRAAGYTALGIGAAGIAVGAITGGMFLADRAQLSSECPDSHCSPDHERAVAQYRTLGSVSTVGFVVGAVGVATGSVLLLSAPRANREIGRGPAIDWAVYLRGDTAGVRGVF